ncbi:vWA domain-containing protein, partial [Victivallis sp.]|uniref:vWA domain-containing protein n=1 Tax=Victivallis sp. TaxID=2049020 RepID=UPI003A8F2CE0
MNFIHPQFFYAAPLLLAAVVILSISATARRRKKLAALLGSSATDPDAVKLSPARRRLRNGCLLLAMLFLVAAAARPFWDSQLVPYEPHGRDLMVLFDVSKSMRATDIAPSRLDHAKFLLRQLVEADSGDRFGLVAFAGNAYLACPLTSDQLAFNQYIDELSTDTVPLGGTNLELALNTAMTAFKAAAAGNRAIVLMTDGDELTGDSSRIVNELKKKEIPVFVIGLGDPEVGAPVPEEDGTLKRDRDGKLVTTRLNEVNLRRLAAETGGIYVRSTVTDTGLAAIENRIKRLDQAEQEGGKRTVPIEKFPLALIAAGVFLLIYFLISERPGDHRKPRASKALLLLLGILFGAELAAAPTPAPAPESAVPAIPAKPEARTEGSVKVEPELPDTPDELYNVAREKQLSGDEQAPQLYENVIRQAVDRPDLQARSFHNLGTGEHLQVRKGFAGAMAQVKAQQLDPALQELTQAEARAKSAEELYVRSLSIPQNEAALAASTTNLQQLADDRKKIEELKKKIEE